MSTQEALVLILTRNAFYKRMHYLALATFGLAVLLIAMLTAMLIFLYQNPTQPLYFATDEVGRLITIVPVNMPNMSRDDTIAWAKEAAEATFSYDYINFRSQLQNAQKYFTNYGWSKYMSALTAANNLTALNQRKMLVKAQVVDQPTILQEGLIAGSYAWKVKMPMLMTYYLPPYDDKSKFSNPLEVTVIVKRLPVLQGYKGLGIVQIIGSVATAPINQPQQISSTPTG